MALAVLIFIFLIGAGAWRLLVDSIHRRVIERLALAPGMSVVDIGSGPGQEVGPHGEVVSLGGNRFDRAVLVAVLGEIHNRDAAMSEIYCALQPGGLLVVTEVVFDPHRRSVEDLHRVAGAAGFVEHAVDKGLLAVTMTFRTPSG